MSSTAHDSLPRHRLSLEDYHRMAQAGILREDDRVELIEGEIIDMTPIGSWHAGIVAQLSHILEQAIKETATLWVQNPIILGPHSEPEPDLALLKPRDDFYKTAHPRAKDILLIIEVADSSLNYDRDIKLPLYARHNISETWLIDGTRQHLLQCREPTPDGYRQMTTPDDLTAISPLCFPDMRLDLSVLFE